MGNNTIQKYGNKQKYIIFAFIYMVSFKICYLLLCCTDHYLRSLPQITTTTYLTNLSCVFPDIFFISEVVFVLKRLFPY